VREDRIGQKSGQCHGQNLALHVAEQNGATVNAGVENAIRSKRLEYAGVEKSGANRRAGKCSSRVAVWEAEQEYSQEYRLIKLNTFEKHHVHVRYCKPATL